MKSLETTGRKECEEEGVSEGGGLDVEGFESEKEGFEVDVGGGGGVLED